MVRGLGSVVALGLVGAALWVGVTHARQAPAAETERVDGVVLAWTDAGWVPACRGTMVDDAHVLTAQACALQGLQLAFSTDSDLPRTASGSFAMSRRELGDNALDRAWPITSTRVRPEDGVALHALGR